MKKTLTLFFSALIIAFSAGTVSATPPSFLEANVAPSQNHAKVVIPEKAAELSPGVFDLGSAIDSQGRSVQGYAFIKYKNGFLKPFCGDNICQGRENASNCSQDCGGGGSTTTVCYGYLGNGVKWQTPEPWIVNTSNQDGLDSQFTFDQLTASINTWESTASADILGNGSTTSATLVADTSSPDDQNEVYFGDISDPGAIGVTIVWGIFRGPPSVRQLTEWDQVYDDVDFNWTADATLEPTKMDFPEISIHELGHSVGLDDIYQSECSEETMFGFATEGETKKRDLGPGDIEGIQSLY